LISLTSISSLWFTICTVFPLLLIILIYFKAHFGPLSTVSVKYLILHLRYSFFFIFFSILIFELNNIGSSLSSDWSHKFSNSSFLSSIPFSTIALHSSYASSCLAFNYWTDCSSHEISSSSPLLFIIYRHLFLPITSFSLAFQYSILFLILSFWCKKGTPHWGPSTTFQAFSIT